MGIQREVNTALSSLRERSPEFQAQVDRMRAFKKRMQDAGVEIRQNEFSISLSEGRSLVGVRCQSGKE